jgi:hypothetical protein
MKVATIAVIFSLLMTNCKKETNTIADPIVTPVLIVNIPDTNFKAILVNDLLINTNGNSEIEVSEASRYSGSILAQNSSIKSVEGIQSFTNVTRIVFFGNNLTEVDLSYNIKVTQLLLENNQLKIIDVSTLSQLTDFKCHSNDLTKANLANGNNTNMTRMQLQANPNLICVQVDSLPAPTSGWSIGLFSTNCF